MRYFPSFLIIIIRINKFREINNTVTLSVYQLFSTQYILHKLLFMGILKTILFLLPMQDPPRTPHLLGTVSWPSQLRCTTTRSVDYKIVYKKILWYKYTKKSKFVGRISRKFKDLQYKQKFKFSYVFLFYLFLINFRLTIIE